MRALLLCLIYAPALALAFANFAPDKLLSSQSLSLLALGVLAILIITWDDKTSGSESGIGAFVRPRVFVLISLVGIAMAIYGVVEFFTPDAALTLGDDATISGLPFNKLIGGVLVFMGVSMQYVVYRLARMAQDYRG